MHRIPTAIACAASVCLALASAKAADASDFSRPEIDYSDGTETFSNPARGCAGGGWKTFKPEGLPDWHGAKAYNSSLWELSRFSGGREQRGKRPLPERVGTADIPLTGAMKADVRRFLEETRQNGGSLIVRLGYTWSEQQGCEPENFDIVLGHIEDLSKIMADFDDVIVGIEAGVAGPWGEMHSSDYCKPEYMNRILDAYIKNLPPRISILVRSPGFINKYSGTATEDTLKRLPFRDSGLERLGMYNDGYLGTWWDYGTWAGDFKRERGVEMLKTFENHPYGGEFAYVSLDWIENNREKTHELFELDKWNVVKEWYDTHLNYLRNVKDEKHSLCVFLKTLVFESGRYHFEGMPDLHEYDGIDLHKFCDDHMGYRFVVRDARIPRKAAPGAKTMAALDVENTGFGKLLLDSRAEALLIDSSGEPHAASAPDGRPQDVFSAIAGGERRRIKIPFTVPRDLKRGEYGLFLRVSAPLKDETPGGTPRRPVRFANAGMWDEGLKANAIGKIEIK